ncbi:MAG: hypothetical protein R3E66_02325 [bacterium]
MNKTIALSLLGLMAATQLSCGAPSYCKEGSFPTFLDEEWRSYCTKYSEHMDNVGAYTLPQLTQFFGNHPDKVAELNETRAKYQEPSACFVEERDKLEFRKLDSCLDNNDEQNQAIANAWIARAEPWLEDHKLRLSGVIPKIGDQMREAKRLERKAGEAFEFKAEIDPGAFLKFADENEALGKELDVTADIEGEWRDLLRLAGDNKALTGAMQAEYGAAVQELVDKLADARANYSELTEQQRYLEMATFSAGKPCPLGLRSNKEVGIAKKAMASKIKEVKGTAPRAMTSIAKELVNDLENESFEGFICAPRSSDNQFSDRPKQCAVYRYVLQRDRPVNERKWGDWTITAFEEGGPQAGVDCGIMK